MALTIFLYNMIKIRCEFKNIFNSEKDRFILLASKKCLENLSDDNRSVFEEIILLEELHLNAVEKKLSKYLEKQSKETVTVLTNDESCILICAKLREKYQLRGSSVAEVRPFLDKVLMKEKLLNSTIQKPKFFHFDYAKYHHNETKYLQKIEENIPYPMIAKPIDSFGSIDTAKIYSSSDLKEYIDRNKSMHKHFEIDEYIEGKLYHCDGLIKNNNILIFLCGIYNTPCMNFTKKQPLGSIALEKDDALRESLLQLSNQIIKVMNAPDGAFHLEVFLTHDQRLIFLEVAIRTPGAFVIPVYEKMFGFNLEEQHYRLQMQLPHVTHLHPAHCHAAWIMYPRKEGIVANFNAPELKSEHEIYYLIKINQETRFSESLLETAAAILIFNESYETVLNDFIRLQSFEPISYVKKI